MDPWLIQLIGIQFAFMAFIIWLVARSRGESARRRTEERLRLIERFESKDDLETFLDSSSGRRYLDNAGQRPSDPRRAILISLALGIVSLAMGGGMIFMSSPPLNEDGMVIPGTILISGGIGILIAATLSLLLVRLWGLDNGHGKDT